MRVLTGIVLTAVSCAATLTGVIAPAAAATAPAYGGGDHHVKGKAHLDGRQEVPGPGDRNGRGEFHFKIKKHTFCYSLKVRNIARPTAAHIHAGRRGVAGPIVFTLKTPKHGESHGCIMAKHRQNPWNADRVLTVRELRAIATEPDRFYVNVHNQPFPDGAIRGQLKHDDHEHH